MVKYCNEKVEVEYTSLWSICEPVNVIIVKTKILLPPGQTLLNYLSFLYFEIERTLWKLLQKRIVRTKFDIYVFLLHIYASLLIEYY
jgi:hypothetical protein